MKIYGFASVGLHVCVSVVLLCQTKPVSYLSLPHQPRALNVSDFICQYLQRLIPLFFSNRALPSLWWLILLKAKLHKIGVYCPWHVFGFFLLLFLMNDKLYGSASDPQPSWLLYVFWPVVLQFSIYCCRELLWVSSNIILRPLAATGGCSCHVWTNFLSSEQKKSSVHIKL